jgi:Myb/SANT-like DNA-binding protein
VLFKVLLKQDRLGKQADAGFKSEAWIVVLAAVQAEYNLGNSKKKLTVTQVKNKESNYRGLFKDWLYLIEQSGFGKHLETGYITITKEAWDNILQVYITSYILASNY